ncbi:hypothetical protein JCM6882_000699 [Rhodosporidiobolus microsporus]
MPPTRTHAASSSSSSDASSSAHPSAASSSSSSRRRKGIPHKSPARTTTTAITGSPSASTSASVNGPVLLRLLLASSSRDSLDNKRHRPAESSAGSKLKLKKKSLVGARDVLPAVQEGYGRGNRVGKRALNSDYVELGQAFPPSSSAGAGRGRSPGAKGKARDVYGTLGRSANLGAGGGTRRAASASTASLNYSAGTSSSAYHQQQHPTGGSYADYLAVPGSSGKMARAASVGSSVTRTSPTMAAAYAAPVPSPLARSFSANGAVTTDREARSRVPSSSSGIARVAELGGHAFDYSPSVPYVAA